MKLKLERAPYEKLIKHIVYMEENLDDIASSAADMKLFPTEKRAKWFLEDYIGEVESLFREAEIVEDTACISDLHINSLPFIVLGSSFTLIDRKKRVRFCRMTHDPLSECNDTKTNIYFLSGAGRALLLKSVGDDVSADIGTGLTEFSVNSINIS